MNDEVTLSRITIYPVKSLDGMVLNKAMITEGGCLLHDREYAMSNESGNLITGKTNPLVHCLRSTVDFANLTISFRRQAETAWNEFHAENEKDKIQAYLSDYFGAKTILVHDKNGRFLDIPDISGATIVSTSSLQSVSKWYNNLNLEETRKRFRATLEIEGVPAFWEDHLFSSEGMAVEFTIGDVKLIGIKPRARCIVPTRNPESAEVIHAFAKTFAKCRSSSLPEWSRLDEYGHCYHLTVDCHIPATEIGKWINTGDRIQIKDHGYIN